MSTSCLHALAALSCLVAARAFVFSPTSRFLPELSLRTALDDAMVFDSEGSFPMSTLNRDAANIGVSDADMRVCFQTGECEVPQEFEQSMTKAFNQMPYMASKQTMTVVDGDSEYEEPINWAAQWIDADLEGNFPVTGGGGAAAEEFSI